MVTLPSVRSPLHSLSHQPTHPYNLSLGNLIELRSIRKLGTFWQQCSIGTRVEYGPVLLNYGHVLLNIRYYGPVLLSS